MGSQANLFSVATGYPTMTGIGPYSFVPASPGQAKLNTLSIQRSLGPTLTSGLPWAHQIFLSTEV